jgi:hypothetical protein
MSEPTKPSVRWVNVYPNGLSSFFETKKEAESHTDKQTPYNPHYQAIFREITDPPAWPPEAVAACQAATRDAQAWQVEADLLRAQMAKLSEILTAKDDEILLLAKTVREQRFKLDIIRQQVNL